jgi:ADP-ribosyl-[dinitrogen reductase] hydrolase
MTMPGKKEMAAEQQMTSGVSEKYAPNELAMVNCAQGCLLGQLTGDALGSLVEFQTPEEIRANYPDGVRELVDGSTWNTIAGQPTDDSEMALLLARSLIDCGTFDEEAVSEAYRFWLASGPFDRGMTISTGLRGQPNPRSQANGAMMRISPLGIFGASHDLAQVDEWAQRDAELTHPNELCKQANSLFAMAISFAIKDGADAQSVYQKIVEWASGMNVKPGLLVAIHNAANEPPTEFVHQQGWVLIAFQNALWQLLHAPSFEEGVIDTVTRGGDTDTNAAICGALLGAVYGLDAIPTQWREKILSCRPEAGFPGVHQPRPECFWPVDALELAEQLVVPRKQQ